jgi:hypothetical protein
MRWMHKSTNLLIFRINWSNLDHGKGKKWGCWVKAPFEGTRESLSRSKKFSLKNYLVTILRKMIWITLQQIKSNVEIKSIIEKWKLLSDKPQQSTQIPGGWPSAVLALHTFFHKHFNKFLHNAAAQNLLSCASIAADKIQQPRCAERIHHIQIQIFDCWVWDRVFLGPGPQEHGKRWKNCLAAFYFPHKLWPRGCSSLRSLIFLSFDVIHVI